MIKYPVEGDKKLIEELINKSKAFYPITKHGFWHNGAHFTSNSAAVCNIHTGEVVAMRLTEDYEKTGDKMIAERHEGIFAGHKDCFTLEGGFYTIKKELPEEDKLIALIMIGVAFSNNFVLVKHSAENLYGDNIDFYSLAMHLRPLNKLTFAEKLTMCWYDVKVEIDSEPKYNYVTVSDVNDEEGTDGEIPCETIINVLSSVITWTLNGASKTSTIETSKHRLVNGNEEVKRPVNDDDNTGGNYLEKEEYFDDGEGVLVYSGASKSSRAVKYLFASMNDISLVDKEFYVDYNEDKGIEVSFNPKDGTNYYIYPEFTNAVDEIEDFIADIKNTTETTTDIMLGNFYFKLEPEDTESEENKGLKFSENNTPTYNYVKGYNDKGEEDKLPCEVIIKEVPSDEIEIKVKVEWILNGETKTGTIETSKYRWMADTKRYEIKRPANIAVDGETGNDDYLQGKAGGEYKEADGLLVYSTKIRKKRSVKYLLTSYDITLVDRKFHSDVSENIGILVSFNDNTQSGYIYHKISDTKTFNEDIKDTTKTKVELENFSFEIKLNTGLTSGKIGTPTNSDVVADDIIGYLGVGGSTSDAVLPLHYEIFCPNDGFMNPDSTKKIPCSYKIINPIFGFTENPKTIVNTKSTENLNNVHLEIIGEKNLIPGEVFYEISVKASILTIEDSYVNIENPTNEIEEFHAEHYYMYTPTGTKKFCDKYGNETEKNKMYIDFSYLLELTEKDSTIYKVVYLYTSLKHTIYEDATNTFWINVKHFEELVKSSATSIDIKRLSENDYFLTGSLSATKILEEPKKENIEWGTEISPDAEILEVENNYVNAWKEDEKKVKNFKKMRSGTTSYWIDSALFGEDKGNFEKIDNSWNGVFHKVTDFAEKYKASEDDLKKIFDGRTCEELDIMIKPHRVMLSKIVHKCPPEWKKVGEYVEALCEHCGKPTKEFIETKLESLAFWDDVSLKGENWYFHPINFINHLNKVVPINPYICAKKIAYPAEKGMPTLFEVKDSPGFAPVWTSGTNSETGNSDEKEYTVDGKTYYAYITGRFNQDYINVGTYSERYTEYYHEGVDLRGPTGTDIHSLIYAKVIAYGWYENYGKTIILRNLSGIGVYLLAHLSEYMENIDIGVEVIPGQIIGKTGTSGKYLNSFPAHLHITYYHYDGDPTNIFTTTDFIGSSIKQITRNEDEYNLRLLPKTRDPFNHETKKVANK